MKLLLVEDDKLFQNSITTFAKSLDIELLIVNDGKDAVELCTNGNYFDIILMDNYMIGLNGVAATQQIRSLGHGNTYKIFLISGDEISEEEVKSIGLDGFIKKPMYKSDFELLISKFR